tara:strand:+ start:4031 stop:4795 length:765 start_codon:yes stop_codon:yes gene_type:complete
MPKFTTSTGKIIGSEANPATLEEVQALLNAGLLTDAEVQEWLIWAAQQPGGLGLSEEQIESLNPTGTPVPMAEPFAGTATDILGHNDERDARFQEQETFEQFGDIFSQFLAQRPGQLSALGRRALERQFNPALASFATGISSPEDTFRNFLAGLGEGATAIQSPASIAQRLTGIGSLFDVGAEELTPIQQARRNIFESNPFAFNVALGNLQRRTSPFLRTAFSNVAQRAFDRFQGATPELPFVQALSRMGGKFF